MKKEEIEQVETKQPKTRRNSKPSESTIPMEMTSKNVEVDDADDDNVFEIDKFVHSLGFKASHQVIVQFRLKF